MEATISGSESRTANLCTLGSLHGGWPFGQQVFILEWAVAKAKQKPSTRKSEPCEPYT